RFDKMINNGPSDIFITGFFLVPGACLFHLHFCGLQWMIAYRDAKILKKINPLALPRVTIQLPTSSRPHGGVKTADQNETFKRIGSALVLMLKAEYEVKNEKIGGLSACDAIAQLKSQILVYSQCSWPFNCPFKAG